MPKFNIVYNSNAIRTPSGKTPNQLVAGLNNVGAVLQQVDYPAQTAPSGNRDAAAVIQSNGELVGNVVRKSNPLPPGITS